MISFDEESQVIEKTKELCNSIAQSSQFTELHKQVENFMNDADSKKEYTDFHKFGEQLHQKQHEGLEISESEISEYEQAREKMVNNQITSKFLDAQQCLQHLQKKINGYVGMTLELGRVPSSSEFDESMNSEGCCSSGGCGCS